MSKHTTFFDQNRPTLGHRRPTPRRGAPWATLFLSFLMLLFLGVTVYASVLLYQSAREAAHTLDTLTISLELPRLDTLLGREPAPAPTPIPLSAGEQPPVQVPVVQAPILPNLPNPERNERINILLLGVDKRKDETGPPRTDTIMVVSIDPKTGDTSMLSIPRDLWVPIPGYDINAKINQAYAIGEQRRYPGGGPALVKKTVADLIGYPVHYYVMVDFNGFRKLIDLIGGIEVCVPKTIHDEKFPTEDYGYEVLHIEAGCQHMDGDLALKYARTRHVDSDYGRAWRQQQIILAARDKVLQAKMLPTLLVRAPQILRNLAGSVETDIPLDRLVALAKLAQNVDASKIRQEVIDSRYGEETYSAGGAWILVPDRDKLRPLFDELFAPKGEQDVSALREALEKATVPAPTPQATSTVNPDVVAEQATIVVLNGSGKPGLAAQVSEWLETRGFRVVQFGDVDGNIYPHSVLVVHTDRPRTREVLMQLFRIRPENVRHSANLLTNVDMELFIGADFELPE